MRDFDIFNKKRDLIFDIFLLSRTKQLNKAIEDPKIKNIRLVEKDLDVSNLI